MAVHVSESRATLVVAYKCQANFNPKTRMGPAAEHVRSRVGWRIRRIVWAVKWKG